MSGENRFLQEQISRCSECGQCVRDCPAYAESGLETENPRGRLALAREFYAGKLVGDQIVNAFSTCLQCGRCDVACPAGIALNSIFFFVRLRLKLPVGRQKRLLASIVLKKPEVLDFIQPLVMIGLRIAHLRTRKKYDLAFTPYDFRAENEKKYGREIILYTGCIARRFLPGVVEASLAALRKHGYQPNLLPALVCCGRPAAMQGRNIAAAVRRNLDIIKSTGCEELTSPCPGCLSTIRNIWPFVDGLSMQERKLAEKLATNTGEIGAILAAGLKSQPDIPSGLPAKMLWHRPCLLPEQQFALAVLQTRPNLQLIFEQDELSCCGAPLECLGKEGRINAAGGKRIINMAMDNDCEGIVTGCPGCMYALENYKSGIRIWHFVEIFARGQH